MYPAGRDLEFIDDMTDEEAEVYARDLQRLLSEQFSDRVPGNDNHPRQILQNYLNDVDGCFGRSKIYQVQLINKNPRKILNKLSVKFMFDKDYLFHLIRRYFIANFNYRGLLDDDNLPGEKNSWTDSACRDGLCQFIQDVVKYQIHNQEGSLVELPDQELMNELLFYEDFSKIDANLKRRVENTIKWIQDEIELHEKIMIEDEDLKRRKIRKLDETHLALLRENLKLYNNVLQN